MLYRLGPGIVPHLFAVCYRWEVEERSTFRTGGRWCSAPITYTTWIPLVGSAIDSQGLLHGQGRNCSASRSCADHPTSGCLSGSSGERAIEAFKRAMEILQEEGARHLSRGTDPAPAGWESPSRCGPDRPQGKCGRGSGGDHRSLPHFRKGPRCLRSPVPPEISSRQQNRSRPASGPQRPDHGKIESSYRTGGR